MTDAMSEFNIRFSSSIGTFSEIEDSAVFTEIQNELRTRITPSVVELTHGSIDSRGIWALSLLLREPEFQRVSTLILSENELNDEALMKLRPTVTALKHVVRLDLSDNNFTEVGVYHLLLGLSKSNKCLEDLSLEDNTGIKGSGIGYIGEIIEACTSLVRVNLSSIPLNSNLDAILNGIKSSRSLRSLILENTHLDEDLLEIFISGLCHKSNKSRIKELNLNFNQCSSFAVYAPLFTHSKFRSLAKLHLSYLDKNNNTGFRNSPVQYIYRFMKNNKSIRELYLVGNNFQNRDCKTLQFIIGLPSNLLVLDLSDNNIEQAGAFVLLSGVKKNKKLRVLRLIGNRFLQEEQGRKLHKEINDVLSYNCRLNNSLCSYMTGTKSKERLPKSECGISDGSAPKLSRAFLKSKICRDSEMSKDASCKSASDSEGEESIEDDSPNLAQKVAYRDKLLKFQFEVPKLVLKASFEDNLNNDWDSIIIEEEDSTNRRKSIATHSGLVKNKTSFTKIVNSGSNNLDNEEATCIILENDDQASVLYDETNNEGEEYNSVVFENNELSINEQMTLIQARDPKKLFNTPTEKFSVRSSDNTAANWDYQNVTKSEMNYIQHVQLMTSKNVKSKQNPVAILDLSEKDIEMLAKMLSEFENLLDREENLLSVTFPKRHKRNFVKKFGVIGHLNKQESGKVIDYTLAKSIIDKSLISRQLVRNITLINTFAKLRREIGSGVPTKMGGMLPSVFFGDIVNKTTGKMLSISILESFASSLLLIKVVIWSILKAFTVCKPSVDPDGRHLLEEFGKAMIEKDSPSGEKGDYKNKSHSYTILKKAKLGKYIITGAVYELIDILVLLRPIFAITEALHTTVASQNPQTSLSKYEAMFNAKEKKVKKRLGRKQDKIQKLNLAHATLQRVKKTKKVMENTDSLSEISKKPKQIHDFLTQVEKLHNHTKLRHEKKKKPSSIHTPKLPLSSEIVRYRENCPERVMNVISDLQAETKSLCTILSVGDFFPILLAFCDYTNVVKYYQGRVRSVMETMPLWVKSLSADFKVEILDHFAPAVIPEVEKNIKPRRNFVPRGMSSIYQDKDSELANVFARLRKKKSSILSSDSIYTGRDIPLKPEDESFFDPILNRMFSWKRMTPAGAKKIREVVQKKISSDKNIERHEFMAHLKYLCQNGCNKTISRLTLEARDMFSDGTILLE